MAVGMSIRGDWVILFISGYDILLSEIFLISFIQSLVEGDLTFNPLEVNVTIRKQYKNTHNIEKEH